MNTKLPARLVSVLRGFFGKLVSLGERGWQVPEGHFNWTSPDEVIPLKGTPAKEPRQVQTVFPSALASLWYFLCIRRICISYPQLLLEKFRLLNPAPFFPVEFSWTSYSPSQLSHFTTETKHYQSGCTQTHSAFALFLVCYAMKIWDCKAQSLRFHKISNPTMVFSQYSSGGYTAL